MTSHPYSVLLVGVYFPFSQQSDGIGGTVCSYVSDKNKKLREFNLGFQTTTTLWGLKGNVISVNILPQPDGLQPEGSLYSRCLQCNERVNILSQKALFEITTPPVTFLFPGGVLFVCSVLILLLWLQSPVFLNSSTAPPIDVFIVFTISYLNCIFCSFPRLPVINKQLAIPLPLFNLF